MPVHGTGQVSRSGIDGREVLARGQPVFGTMPRLLHTGTDLVGPMCIVALGIIGVLFIYSAQHFIGANFWFKQIIWFGVGGLVYCAISMMDYHILFKYAHVIYALGLILLFALWTPLGVEREGSRRWLNTPFMSLQPSETAKIATLIMVSSVLARERLGTVRESLWALIKVGLFSGIPIILIFLQPDLGSAMVFGPMIFSLLYVSRLSQRFFIVVFGTFLAVMAVIGTDIYRYHEFLKDKGYNAHLVIGEYQKQSWVPLHDYQRNRILGFISPEAVDPHGIGVSWNYRQSVQAVGTGGPFGKGWTKGDQAQLGYLPRSVAHNDFIFAVVGEESGFAGASLVIGIYLVLLINNLRLASQARDRFGLLLIVGVSAIIMMHVFVNIGMTIGVTPITGVPLPFISYGGSFILSCCILQGLVQSVYRHRRSFS
jgi:rod shape determining protein RodA